MPKCVAGTFPVRTQRSLVEFHFSQTNYLPFCFPQTALGVLFRSSQIEDYAKVINPMTDLFVETFGDHITPLRSDNNIYSMCFL
jgi:hypothetical protein